MKSQTHRRVLCLILLSVSILFLDFQCQNFTLKNRKVVDYAGRQMYFHGTNIVAKRAPYIPSNGEYDEKWSFNSEDIQILKQNGFNAIRLGVMWQGVEPKKDWYNQTFLQEMVDIVNRAGKEGIYTLVQFHIDLLAESFCGDGVPLWLIQQMKRYKSFPFPLSRKYPLQENGFPSDKDCYSRVLAQYYFSLDVAQGYNQMYNTNSHLFHKVSKYWQKVASAFKGNPYVISYELMNEPWVGNLYRNPLLLAPTVADTMKFQHFYDELSQAIKQVDPVTPLCFEPITYDNFFRTGFTHPPGGRKYANLSLLCYHYYSPPEINLNTMDKSVKEAERLGVGAILSETFGDLKTLDRAERLKQSWMYWKYKDFGTVEMENKFGQANPELLSERLSKIKDHMVRTYLQRVAGELIESTFSSESHHFSGSYWATPSGESILYLSKEKSYPNGYEILAYPSEQTQIEEEGNFVRIRFTGKQRRKVLIVVNRLS